MRSDCELIYQLKRLDDATEIDLPSEVIDLLDEVFTPGQDGQLADELTSEQRKLAREVTKRYGNRLDRLGK